MSTNKTSSCPCGDADNQQMVCCDCCDIWYHLDCVTNFDDNHDENSIWYCQACQDNEDFKQLKQDEYLVKDILDWGLDVPTNKRKFLVLWNTEPASEQWEYEENLAGCKQILNSFLTKNKLDASKINCDDGFRFGFGPNSGKVNRKNWLRPEEIIDG